jgi:(heptosyl)LPS beta-1,4-glucosyltransferase
VLQFKGMGKISAVINVIEEEVRYLPRVLSSLESFVDDIVIVDMTSGKEVSQIAKKVGARAIKHEFVNYVEPVRNFGISKASGEWILIIDPDEEIPENLAKKLREIANGDIHPSGKPLAQHHPTGERELADYYRIPRKNIVFGKWLKHSRWWPDYNIRFFKKGFVSWNEVIHGVPLTQGKGVDLEAKEELAITHYHYSSVEQFLERMNRYTSVQARDILKTKYKFIWKDLVEKPFGEFLSRYFAGEGYKDGLHGLAMALLQAFSELILYIKVWQAEKFLEQGITVNEIEMEMRGRGKEVNWWLTDMLIKSKDELSAVPLKIYRKFFLRNI